MRGAAQPLLQRTSVLVPSDQSLDVASDKSAVVRDERSSLFPVGDRFVHSLRVRQIGPDLVDNTAFGPAPAPARDRNPQPFRGTRADDDIPFHHSPVLYQ
jgi:hypothetical protein